MFKTKRTKRLEENIKTLKRENKELEKRNNRLENENNRLRSDLNYEHEENYKNHHVLLIIKKILNKPYGSYKDLLSLRKDIKKELDNAVNID